MIEPDREQLLGQIVSRELEITRRIASHVVPVASGFVALHEKYPASHDNNVLEVTQWHGTREIVRDVDRVFGAAGLRYRHIHIRDESLALRLASGFIEMGFEQSVRLVMVFTEDRCNEIPWKVDRVPYETMARDVEQAWRRALPKASEEEIRQLVERRLAREAVCDMSYHAICQDNRYVSRCEVSRYGGIALIDGVVTDPEWQRRGFARSVVLDAVELSKASGCSIVWLETERDDWPQQFYRRLGFSEIGLIHGYWKRE